MNYLPVQIPSDHIFRLNEYNKPIDFTAGYLDGKTIYVEFFSNNRSVGIKNLLIPFEDSIQIYLTSDQVSKLPQKFEYFLIFDDIYLFGSQIFISMGCGENNVKSTQINIIEGQPIIVEVEGLAFLDSLVQEVTDALPTRVDTFANMILLPVRFKPRWFVVITDEYQTDVNVPYMWDGYFLYEYGISICDIQPTL